MNERKSFSKLADGMSPESLSRAQEKVRGWDFAAANTPAPIAPGAVVAQPDGPAMTVDRVEGDVIHCAWFVAEECFRDSFPRDGLYVMTKETITYSRSALRRLVIINEGIHQNGIHSEYWDDDGSLTIDVWVRAD